MGDLNRLIQSGVAAATGTAREVVERALRALQQRARSTSRTDTFTSATAVYGVDDEGSSRVNRHDLLRTARRKTGSEGNNSGSADDSMDLPGATGGRVRC